MRHLLSVVALATSLLFAGPALAQDTHVGMWVSPVAHVQLNPDGSFAWQGPQQLLQGTYELRPGLIVMTTPAGSMSYGLAIQGDALLTAAAFSVVGRRAKTVHVRRLGYPIQALKAIVAESGTVASPLEQHGVAVEHAGDFAVGGLLLDDPTASDDVARHHIV